MNEYEIIDSEKVKILLDAWDDFALGVGLFYPQLLDLPVFMRVFDARQDVVINIKKKKEVHDE